ncbi:MAG: type II toxin-antitoxin system HipA family toxin [Rhodobacteraceae bacterium]|nr:type II toxin-antitoxin system HipA family toxin [Paracoccaceae bacterium]
MADVGVLEVMLHGEPIGTLTRVSGDTSFFAFSEAYVADVDRPVLSLGFKNEFGELITAFGAVTMQLMPFFSNLLPEGRMRDYLARRAGVKPVREFFLLCALGRDLPGAVAVRPANGEVWPPDAADVDHRARPRNHPLRFSLAGVQLKFSAMGGRQGGLTVPARGIGGSWIVKLPAQGFDAVPENEFSMMTLARLCGMNVPPIRLVDVSAIGNLPESMTRVGGQALAVERFDRLADGTAVHIEDFAQVFRVYPDDKYRKASQRNIAQVLAAECCTDDIAEFVRRLTFSVLIGNADMHLKNWSLIYPDRRQAALAPCYDFVATIVCMEDDGAALKFSRTRKFSGFSRDELSHLAAKSGLSGNLVLRTASETVARFHERWKAEKKNLPLTADAIRAIDAHLRTVPIVQETGRMMD